MCSDLSEPVKALFHVNDLQDRRPEMTFYLSHLHIHLPNYSPHICFHRLLQHVLNSLSFDHFDKCLLNQVGSLIAIHLAVLAKLLRVFHQAIVLPHRCYNEHILIVDLNACCCQFPMRCQRQSYSVSFLQYYSVILQCFSSIYQLFNVYIYLCPRWISNLLHYFPIPGCSLAIFPAFGKTALRKIVYRKNQSNCCNRIVSLDSVSIDLTSLTYPLGKP